jgi:hypothetical protein
VQWACKAGEVGLATKVSFSIPWNGGTMRAEADTPAELAKLVAELRETSLLTKTTEGASNTNETQARGDYPQISVASGCADAIRRLLSTDWGRNEARTESELASAMKSNALHYGHGTISGLLTHMTQRGQLRRLKKGQTYAYVLSRAPDISEP